MRDAFLRKHHFTAMKNHTTSNSAQTWVTKTVNHHSTYPDLFAGSHLLTAQKPASECYGVERFFGTIAQRSDFISYCLM